MQSTINLSEKSAYYLELEEKYGAHNYHPLPVVLPKAKEYFYGMWTEKNITIS